jgi:hypothetical protein
MKRSDTLEKIMRGFLLLVALSLILAGGIETGSLVPRRSAISSNNN